MIKIIKYVIIIIILIMLILLLINYYIKFSTSNQILDSDKEKEIKVSKMTFRKGFGEIIKVLRK